MTALDHRHHHAHMQSRPSLSLVSARSQRIAQHDLARHLVEWEHLGYEIEERPLEHVRRAAGTRVSAPPLTHTYASASRRLRSTSAERRSGRRASRSAASIWASRVWSAMSTSSTDAGAAGAGTAAPKPGPVAPTTAAMPFYMHAGTRHLGRLVLCCCSLIPFSSLGGPSSNCKVVHEDSEDESSTGSSTGVEATKT